VAKEDDVQQVRVGRRLQEEPEKIGVNQVGIY